MDAGIYVYALVQSMRTCTYVFVNPPKQMSTQSILQENTVALPIRLNRRVPISTSKRRNNVVTEPHTYITRRNSALASIVNSHRHYICTHDCWLLVFAIDEFFLTGKYFVRALWPLGFDSQQMRV